GDRRPGLAALLLRAALLVLLAAAARAGVVAADLGRGPAGGEAGGHDVRARRAQRLEARRRAEGGEEVLLALLLAIELVALVQVRIGDVERGLARVALADPAGPGARERAQHLDQPAGPRSRRLHVRVERRH